MSFFAPKTRRNVGRGEPLGCRRIFVGSTQQLVRIAVPAAQHISTSSGHCLVCPFVPPQNWKQVQLRPRWLYKSDAFYWRIFAYKKYSCSSGLDAVLHSASYHMDGRSFNSDVHSYLGGLLPVAEILRRTLWGFLLLEVKTIKISDSSSASQSVATEELESLSTSLNSGSKHGSSLTVKNFPSWLGNPQQLQHDASTISTRCGWFELSDEIRHKLFITELSLWAVAFIGFGLWATT